MKADGDLLNKLKLETTHKIEKSVASFRGGKPQKLIETIRNYELLGNNIIAIPRGRIDLIPADYEIVDKTISNIVPYPNTLISLRPDQEEVVSDVTGDCFINAKPGWGKTFTALHLAKRLSERTLVVTHNTILKDHWIKEIDILFNMDAGEVSANNFDIDGHAIVVGNIQTVTKHALSLSKEFGCLIVDEAHHTPAETFTTLISNSHAKYRIGLSGTMNRRDGRHVMFKDYFGSKVYVPAKSNTMDPVVKLVKTGIQLTPGEVWARKINNLLYDPDYQQLIAALAANRVSAGHNVLIIADRIEFLQNVKELLGETCVLVVGETGSEDRDVVKDLINSKQKRIIAGSRSIFSEGISINSLSSVILATPIANEALLEQIVGRIMREHPDKPTPEVLDLQFSGHADRKQNNLRLGFYMQKGWKVVGF